MQKVQRNHVTVVLKLLAESVRQPREAPHGHAHRKVLALHVAGTHVLGVGITAHYLHIAPDAGRRTIAALIGIDRSAEEFVQHRIIDICAKGILDSINVMAQRICGDLRASNNALGTILHELVSRPLAAISHVIRHAEFRVGINGSPRPRVTPALLLLLWRHVLSLCSDELPDFIALQTPNPYVANVAVMVFSTSTSGIFQSEEHTSE